MSGENERTQAHSELMKDAFDVTYYEAIAFKKSREDYSPYSYIEDSEDPVFFDDQTLEEWDWE